MANFSFWSQKMRNVLKHSDFFISQNFDFKCLGLREIFRQKILVLYWFWWKLFWIFVFVSCFSVCTCKYLTYTLILPYKQTNCFLDLRYYWKYSFCSVQFYCVKCSHFCIFHILINLLLYATEDSKKILIFVYFISWDEGRWIGI